MVHIGLISCVSKKRDQRAQAKLLYNSPLFHKAAEYVQRNCDTWFILSAKYGLVTPECEISPYEATLNDKSREERHRWAETIWEDLRQHVKSGDRITVLAGERYREFLVPLLNEYGCTIEVPMRGLGIGRQLKWLTVQNARRDQVADVNRLYCALEKLDRGVGGKRLMADCSAKQSWPTKGVYMFFEPGELRHGSSLHRVVRVGTHGVSRGSRATLWNRLRTHRGTSNDLGNHRGSIFRLHVGAALSTRDPSLCIETWGAGSTATIEVRHSERALERQVSEYIGQMSVLWISIQDKSGPLSDRAYIERNLIGLLASGEQAIDPLSQNWLGLYSPDARIRDSGLWNLDHLTYSYRQDFLNVFDEYVAATIGESPVPSGSIAPEGWYYRDKSGVAEDL